MVPIFKNIEPKELSDYIQEQKSLGLTPSFSDFTKGVKPAIQKALCEEQGYICAYCMQRIEPDGQHMKIEHWDTQASNKATPERTVDYSIMLGCCLGKIEKNESCDTFRGHIKKIENQQLKYNPADKTHHNLLGISYEPNGKIHSFDSGFDEQLEKVLNLNDEYLCNKRQRIQIGIRKTIQTLKANNINYNIDAIIANWQNKDSNGKYQEFYGTALYFLETNKDNL